MRPLRPAMRPRPAAGAGAGDDPSGPGATGARRNGRRGTPRDHVWEQVCRSPGVPRPGPWRDRSFSSRRLLGIGDPAHGSPPPESGARAGGAVRRPSDQGTGPRARLVVGGPSDLSVHLREPGAAVRPCSRAAFPSETPCVADAARGDGETGPSTRGAVSSPRAPRPGPPGGLPRGRRVPGLNHGIGILSRSFDGDAGPAAAHRAARSRANPASRSACRSETSSRPMWKRRPGPPGFHWVAVR